MVDLPPIVIILQTFKRTDVALRTIAAARANLQYGGDLIWYVADDGSPEAHVNAVMEHLPDAPWHSQRRGYGANANEAWRKADDYSSLTFWLEDDWELTTPLDLTPYAQALMDESIAMIRLGYLNCGIRGAIIFAANHLYLSFDHEPLDSNQLVFTGHPSLRHTRYRDVYGFYPEGLTPGDTELWYAYQYRMGAATGPGIVWPLNYPVSGLFGHIGTIKTETML